MRCDLDGSNVVTIHDGLNGPYGVALDLANGKLYWTEFSADTIRRSDLDGTNVETLVSSGLTHPVGIALDLTAGKMYWCDGASEYTAKIMRANLDGTSVETLVEDPLVAPSDIALDPAAGKMYWSDLGTDSWWSANLDGSGLTEILLSAYGTPIGCELDVAAQKLYVSDFDSVSEIWRCNVDGSGVEVLIDSGTGAPYALTLGPLEAECGDAWLEGPWLILVTGAETYDYAVYLIGDGYGTFTDMGAYNVPDPAGDYAVAEDCSMTGQLWMDAYAPFTGSLISPSEADMSLGGGDPFDVIKVTDPGALEECWAGWFEQSGEVYDVTLEIDADGEIVDADGFPAGVNGRIYTEQGWLGGLIEVGTQTVAPAEIMFLDATAVGDTVMSGTYGKDTPTGNVEGTFSLELCSAAGVADGMQPPPFMRVANAPNPFNATTVISWSQLLPAVVDLHVYDLSGRLVATLVDHEAMSPGLHDVPWSGRDDQERLVASGVYVYRLESGDSAVTKQMTVLK